jgi:hypothetical protein
MDQLDRERTRAAAAARLARGVRHITEGRARVGDEVTLAHDGRKVRIERVSPSGVTVSEPIERTIAGKVVLSRTSYVIGRTTEVRR